jgi:hypothetical protein
MDPAIAGSAKRFFSTNWKTGPLARAEDSRQVRAAVSARRSVPTT